MEAYLEPLKNLDTQVPDWVLQTFSDVYAPVRAQLAVLEGHATNFVKEQGGAEAIKQYNGFLQHNVNPHSKKLPLMNPFDAVVIALTYLVVVFVLRLIFGFTKEGLRNNFFMKQFQRLHNLHLIILSSYMSFEIFRQAYISEYGIWGNAVDNSAAGWNMAKILWVFYISKIPEFVDTIIMCMRKNFDQITFLHVYHHSTIFVIWWLVIYLAPGGESYFSAGLNSFVHVIMYSYYFFASFGIHFPFKKYITMFQMLQFLANFLQASYDVYTGVKGFPLLLSWILFFYMLTLLALFYNFLVTSQRQAKRAAREKKAGSPPQKVEQVKPSPKVVKKQA
jgi:elongation of very long chain fatty acids protein 4